MRKQQKPRRLAGEPVFMYVSACCQERAVKPPCVKVAPKDRETNSLGSWRCGKCNKPCKVARHQNTLDIATPSVVN